MPYVWTEEQVQSFMDIFHSENTHTHSAFVNVEFEITPDFARSLLPPCLDVPEHPTISISIGLMRESFKGRMLQGEEVRSEEEIGWIVCKAVHEGREGIYSLQEIVSGDYAVASGREFWGNPKKRGSAQMYTDSRTIYAWAERMGTRVIEIEADVGDFLPVTKDERSRYFTIKYDFAPDGSGFASDPLLVTLNNGWDTLEGRELTGVKVTLRPNGFDPVESLELGKIVSATLTYGGGGYLVERVDRLQGGRTYLPYVLGRIYDDAMREPTNEGARIFQ